MTVQSIILAAKDFLSQEFCNSHKRLFYDEHIEKMANRLFEFWHNEAPEKHPPPYMDVECTPSLAEVFQPFKNFLERFFQDPDSEDLAKIFADLLVACGTKNILVILGQRFTPASITDTRAIPVRREKLLQTASIIHSSKLSVGARALTKHTHRCPDNFWGEIRGSAEDKNRLAHEVITKILDHTTWWNVFGHYKHEIVYEARVKEGHGVRWGKDGEELIGFLEPFTENFPTVR